MKKNTIYIICIVLFCLAVAGIIIRYNNQQQEEANKVYTLLPRKAAADTTKEWRDVQARAANLLQQIKEDTTDTKSMLRLAALFIQEARVTGNYMYYDMAAIKYTNDVLRQEPDNFNALVFKSLIYMSQHHFADGLKYAHAAQQVNPYNAYVYGLMVDGNVEMGQYDSAVAYAGKMVSIRPDLTSYSRVSYLREIYGDYKGAIEAMKMAAEAGGAGDEHTEWTRIQLAGLYEKTGDYKTAAQLYQMSLSLRPQYAYAIAGLGRVAMANKDYSKAIAYFMQADSLVNDNSIKEQLSDVYRAAGQTKKADDILKEVIEQLNKDAEAGNKNDNIGHYADRELAYDYLKIKDYDKALDHAITEWNRRPENIDVNETVAWAYYCKGDYAKALPYIKTALKTKSKNPVLLSRAALIYYKAGDTQLAKATMAETSPANPYIEPDLKTETSAMMSKL
jgi:tetratricopeptide (TPR) repeat protein